MNLAFSEFINYRNMKNIHQSSDLYHKIYSGERIAPKEALELFSWEIIDLGMAGDMRRKLIFPNEEVGFIVDRIITLQISAKLHVLSAPSMRGQTSFNPTS